MKHLTNTLLLLILLAMTKGAFACSCGESTFEERIDDADNIVYAVLIEAHIESDDWVYSTATFKVNEVYKGSASETLVLKTPADFGVACGVPLTIGLHYLLLFKNELNLRY